MDISYILMEMFAFVCVILLVCTIYFFLYKHHINKVLADPEKKHIKLAPPYKVLLALIILFAVVSTSFVVISIIPSMNRLSTVNDIEKDVRRIQEISDDWNTEIAMNDRIAAVIAYDSEKNKHIFAIYENNSNSNYVFKYGGKSTSIERSVRVFKFEGVTAFISMNTPHIAAIECHNGERYEIDSNSPFVLIFPSGGFDVYDINGDLINLTQDGWYELTELK